MKKTNLIITLVLAFVLFVTAGCSKTEEELFTEAQEKYNQGDYQQAIDSYDKILKDYPEGPKAVDAIFMTGFIYSNHLNDKENAEKYYNEVVTQYPNHDLAASAKFEIEILGADQADLDSLLQKRIQMQAEKEKDKGKK